MNHLSIKGKHLWKQLIMSMNYIVSFFGSVEAQSYDIYLCSLTEKMISRVSTKIIYFKAEFFLDTMYWFNTVMFLKRYTYFFFQRICI